LIYFPRPYHPPDLAKWKAQERNREVGVSTSQGKQLAYLQLPRGAPERLWVVCAGNGSLALDWSEWVKDHGPNLDAYLFCDYPGYGQNTGKPTPGRIRENLRALIPAACEQLGWSLPADQARLRFFGHSLGAACALIAAEEFQMRGGVLISPFTSMMDMTQAAFKVPLGFLVTHRFDNQSTLRSICAATPPAKVEIFHGGRDGLIPSQMSQTLAAQHPKQITLQILEDCEHNDCQSRHGPAIGQALWRVR
jgi:pimeloyl-ACP methyl ester carboxylesterase